MGLGSVLALLYLRDASRRPIVGVLHGIIGAIGFGALLITLRGPPRGEAMGVGSFGFAAVVLFGIALLLGPLMTLLLKRASRIGGLVLAAHASLAITAFVLFLAWTSNG